MTPVERIARLVGLLDRVQKNATAPRAARSAPTASPAPAVKSAPLAAPPVAAAPSYVAPSPPPPPVAAQPAFPSTPPGLELDAPGHEPESVPPPPPPAPPPPALSSWPTEPISAVKPRPSESPEELGDDDLVDMTTLPPAGKAEDRGEDPDLAVAVGSSSEVEISVEEEEQPPASSRRPKSSEQPDALADSEEDREVPAQTPPPESGPQEAALPMGGALNESRLPDVHQIEADMLGPPSMGPTAEQLGETIELEAPRGPELEMNVGVVAELAPPPEVPPEELEVSLPRAQMASGTFDLGISIPPIDISTKLEPLPTVPAAGRSLQESPTSVDIRSAPADVTLRPLHGATDVARVMLTQASASKVFVDILDQSLAL